MEETDCNETCLSIDFFGRFGNQLYQFYHSFQIAKALSFRRVNIFPGFLHLNHSFKFENIIYHINSGPDKCFHHPFFFNTRKLKKLKEIDLNSTSWLKFRSMVMDRYKADVPPNALVVHIRSGDVFNENCEYHTYGQPPCNYYLDVISMRNWSEVIIVAEDNKNPCVNIVANVSGKFVKRSFDEDIAILSNARNVVFSSGTFGYAIALLSMKIQNVFCFNLPDNIKKECLKCAYINTMNCVPPDKYKKKVLAHWTNHPSQRKMMIKSSCKTWKNYTLF